MSTSNYLTKIAIVGAGGRSGGPMAQELLKTGKHTVTALTRADSEAKLPDGIVVKNIDYEKPETIVEALKGQDALIITLSVTAPRDTEEKLVDAALEAGVKWIIPNGWSPDTQDEGVVKDVFIFQHQVTTREKIQKDGRAAFIGICCGFWHEWSLAIPVAFGIDLLKHEATLIDEGNVKISISTWPQVGKAVAGILSLPLQGEGSKQGLNDLKNKVVYCNSFTISQKEMLASAYRVTGTTESDWKITKEPAQKRYTEGVEAMQKGDRQGFAKMMYTRIFYPDGNGDFETRRGTINELIGLAKEDAALDKYTEVAVDRAKTSPYS